jgi:hypothetical protein
MSDIDLERLLSEPTYALDFQYMIGDVEDFLEFAEANIEWQYRRELQDIRRRAETEEFPPGFKEHLETNAEHRFKVSLPLRVRYGAVIALATSVEWSVGFLVKRLKDPLSKVPRGRNETVHGLLEVQQRTGAGRADAVRDYEALIHVRNCIAHSAGIEEHYQFSDQLESAVGRLSGVSLANWHLFGRHICIEKHALNPYVREMGDLIVGQHKAAHEQRLLKKET